MMRNVSKWVTQRVCHNSKTCVLGPISAAKDHIRPLRLCGWSHLLRAQYLHVPSNQATRRPRTISVAVRPDRAARSRLTDRLRYVSPASTNPSTSGSSLWGRIAPTKPGRALSLPLRKVPRAIRGRRAADREAGALRWQRGREQQLSLRFPRAGLARSRLRHS